MILLAKNLICLKQNSIFHNDTDLRVLKHLRTKHAFSIKFFTPTQLQSFKCKFLVVFAVFCIVCNVLAVTKLHFYLEMTDISVLFLIKLKYSWIFSSI